MQERIEDDYNDIAMIDESEVREYIEPAKKYIEYVEKKISDSIIC